MNGKMLWRARAEAVKYPEFPAGGDQRVNATQTAAQVNSSA